MSFSKKTGSLRDFRIDSLSESNPKSTNAQLQPSGSNPVASPKQSIRSQGVPSVNEWEQENASFGSEQLWKVWEDELEGTKAPQNVLLQNKPVQAATPTMNMPLERSRPVSTTRLSQAPTNQLIEKDLEEEIHPKGPMPWAASLAHTERRMERLGEVEYSNSFKKQEILKIQTGEFMAVLRQEFARQIEVFNEARQSGAHAVHLYRITNTEHDFMLFRNSVKLVVSGQRSGRILFAFNQFLGQIYTQNQNPTFELEAQWGAFEQLLWTYRNERVQIQDIVRFFTSEFIRQSYK